MELSEIIRDVEVGVPVTAEGAYFLVPQPGPRAAAVCAFTGVSVIAADVDPEWVAGRLPDDDLSAPLNPPFLSALESKLARRVNNLDMVLISAPQPQSPALALREVTASAHPRVRRAQNYRDDVRVWETETGRGIVVLGRGLAGRWEVAVEVAPEARGRGIGRALAIAARSLVTEDRPVWAQIAPGNAASVRAFLAAGYDPVGAEALLVA
jgi:GNAT superfamily N-acetyltransferase